MNLFDKSGLRATTAAQRVVDAGPIRWGEDGQFWVYRAGVWSPGRREIAGRIVGLLGEKYRPAHKQAIDDVLQATLPDLAIRPVPRYINFANTMIDWSDPAAPREVAHDPAFLSTVQLPVSWRPGETSCEQFDAFVEQALPIDDRQRVWELLGYLMMSGNPLQKLFLLTGGGGNGKGVLLAVIHALLGRRNVSSIPLGDFAESQFATAEIFGKLANICGDIDATFLERTGSIKALSGEDEIKGERKFGQPFYFEFWGKGLFSANAIPASADSSRGWTRRWELLRFPYEPDKPDRTLKARLTTPESLQAIAVRAVLALANLIERGHFLHGESASEAHRQFAMRSNRVLAWVDEEAYPDRTAVYERKVLYTSYRSWEHSENPGGRPLSASGFYERLAQVPGVRATNSKGRRRIWGLRLNRDVITVWGTPDDDGPEPEPPTEGGADARVNTDPLF